MREQGYYFYKKDDKMEATFKRNAKFWGIEVTDEFKEAFNKTQTILNKIASHTRKEIKSGNIVNITRLGYVTLKDGTELTKAQYKNSISHLFDKDVDSKNESIKRELVLYILERFAGYFGRNGGKTVPTITIKGKGLYYKDRHVKLDKEEKTITLPTICGKFKLKFSQSLKSELIDKDKFGGNFIYKQRAFVVAVDVPFVPQYEPESAIGFDLNKTPKDWVVLSTGETIPAPANILEKFEKIREINKLLDSDKKKPVADRLLRSPQRRKLRYRWKELHKSLRNTIRKEVCPAIIQIAVDEEALLCIDSVKTGQAMGTFGQDYLIPILQEMCENQGIPFYVVPCRNTSRRCSLCGHTAKENRTTVEEFCCVSCGFEEVSHKNAASNIAYQGWRLFEGKVPYGNYEKRNVDNLIKEHLITTKNELVSLN